MNVLVNYVGMMVVIDDLLLLIWYVELGDKLFDVWIGINYCGV